MLKFLSFLTEARRRPVVVTFGRMNPITSGHAKLVNSILSLAKSKKAEAQIYLSHSQDHESNPLSYDDKMRFAQAYFPEVNFVKNSNIKTIYALMQRLSDAGYKQVFLVVGSDRIPEFNRIKQHIGPGPKQYHFDDLQIVSAGERDENDPGVAGMSASKMRQFAKDGNLDAFINGTPNPTNKRLGQKMFVAVRNGLNIRK